MKILFITRELSMFEPLGIMQLSAMVKKEGHKCDFLISRLENTNFLRAVERVSPKFMPVFAHFKKDYEPGQKTKEDTLIREVKKISPEVLAFSTTTGEHNYYLQLNRGIKEELGSVFSIFGGPHPTFFPEMISEDGVDAICRGEGEYPFLELVNLLEDGKDITEIKNLWVKEEGCIYKNDVRPLIEDLDTLPFPDRELIYKYEHLKNFPNKHFMTGRGCPFKCSYCFNHAYNSMYRSKGKLMRRRSVDNVIEEIKEVRSRYGIKKIQFEDDTFILDPEWIKEFSEKYKREIDLPFSCNVRANLVNEDLVRYIKDAGCISVSMGIESGNDYLRNEILKRNMSRKQIVDASRIIKKHGIMLNTNNILGIPGEKLEDVFETLEINVECGVDHAGAFIYQPYPRTELGEYCKEKGYFDGDYNKISVSFYSRTALELREKEKIENLQKLFSIGASSPSLIPLIKVMIKLPKNPIFNYINRLHSIKRAVRVKLG